MELDYRDAAARISAKIDKHFVSRKRPRDHFVRRLGVVGKPKRSRCAGSGLLANLFGKDRGAKSALGKKNAAGQSGNAAAHDGD